MTKISFPMSIIVMAFTGMTLPRPNGEEPEWSDLLELASHTGGKALGSKYALIAFDFKTPFLAIVPALGELDIKKLAEIPTESDGYSHDAAKVVKWWSDERERLSLPDSVVIDNALFELDRSEAIPTRLLEDPHRDLEGEVYG